MDEQIYRKLATVRKTLVDERHDPAGVFVPYYGEAVLGSGGIVFMGQATRGDWASEDGPLDFADSTAYTADFVRQNVAGLISTCFWNFCSMAHETVTGQELLADTSRWGWTNILKLGPANDDLQTWLGQAAQQPACVASIQREFAALHGSIVFILSDNDFGVLPSAIEHWNRPEFPYRKNEWSSSYFDRETRVLYIHHKHPRAEIGNYDRMVAEDHDLAKEHGLLNRRP